MTPTLPRAPLWSDQAEPDTCGWSYGLHQGGNTLSSMRKSAHDGCIRCKLLLDGIEKYTFLPYRPHRTTEATLSEYEPDPGLRVHVRNDPELPLRVLVQYTGMATKTGSLPMELYLYNHPEKPPAFSDIQLAGHIPSNPASQACFSTVREWIRQCDTLHPKCFSKEHIPTTPTRLIWVGSSSNDIKLCHSREMPAGARYVALSHTWGVKEARRKAMPLLLKGNSSARVLGIPWDELTQTFQDAITVTRNIDIPYIWIDSLCIVQDDGEDWAKEAARMASVYKYAYLVVAATSSKNGDDGCLRPRDPSHDLVGPPNGSFHVQRQISHRTIIEWQAESTTMPLLDRAWCFQERLLASRILHYTDHEMMWECQEQLWCECQTIRFDEPSARVDSDNPLTSKLDTFKLSYAAAVASIDPEIRASSWNKVVREYSQRALTFGTDRLPGISGIAKEMALPSMGRYLAGLWEFQLPEALLWETVGGVIDRPWVLPRPLRYAAPTWSWASTLTAVALREKNPVAKSTVWVCRVIDVTCTPQTANPYGHVRDGRLKISGPTIGATLMRTDRVSEATRYDVFLKNQHSEALEKAAKLDMTSDIELIETVVSVVLLVIETWSYDTSSERRVACLALVKSKTHSECYERIGIVSGRGLELSQTKDCEFIIV